MKIFLLSILQVEPEKMRVAGPPGFFTNILAVNVHLNCTKNASSRNSDEDFRTKRKNYMREYAKQKREEKKLQVNIED